MPTTVTPLRYPGGKTKLYPFVRKILSDNNLIGGTYCEPFAGGAGLAMKLLINGDVEKIVINDADPAIFSVWDMIINHSEELCEFIDLVDVSVKEWGKQKKIFLDNINNPGSELGKATFFLNRTNVSGVITGGIIGGKDQTGSFKIDARFNKGNLIKKIQKISTIKDKINLYNLDVFDFMNAVFPMFCDDTLINFDPPYVKKGNKLYKNSFTQDEHAKLRNKIAECDLKWIVTYDICDFIRNLYKDFHGGYIDVYYSAKDIRKAQEYVFFSNNLNVQIDHGFEE